MDTNTQAEILAIEANYVREKACDRLHAAINQLQRSMYDMECYAESWPQPRTTVIVHKP